MTLLDWMAALGALILLWVPPYWLVLHPFAAFWRERPLRLAFTVAALVATGVSLAVVWGNQERLFAAAGSPLWAKGVGLLLYVVEVYVAWKVTRTLGPERLIGKVEMGGAGQLHETGIYARVRHPSYAGMMLAMVGICLLAWTQWMAAVAVVWLVLMRIMVMFEERELVKRFGAPYEEYRRRVPAFLPIRF